MKNNVWASNNKTKVAVVLKEKTTGSCQEDGCPEEVAKKLIMIKIRGSSQ